MARDGNTYAKRQRETLKRQKAEAKRDRRKKRKEGPDTTVGSPGFDNPPPQDEETVDAAASGESPIRP